jgi:DNA-directed RNA polymerase subunit RPC12/RpoP
MEAVAGVEMLAFFTASLMERLGLSTRTPACNIVSEMFARTSSTDLFHNVLSFSFVTLLPASWHPIKALNIVLFIAFFHKASIVHRSRCYFFVRGTVFMHAYQVTSTIYRNSIRSRQQPSHYSHNPILQARKPVHKTTNMANMIPFLYGVTGDACGGCSATTVPLYDLPCHDSDDFHCRDCLTKVWYQAKDEVVRCPSCGQDCAFKPLQPITEFDGIDRNFVDYKAFDIIRQQPEVMNNLIAFTAPEAIVFLQHVYTLYADQLLDPAELGHIPSYRPFQLANTLNEELFNNPFYCGFATAISEAPKVMISPAKLEEIMSVVLNSAVVHYTMLKHSSQLHEAGIEMNDDLAVLQHSQNFEDVNSIKDHWVGILKIWVDLLASRHIERTAPAESGAAERLREPLAL